MKRRWLITDKGDQDCRLLADAHYTRQTPGSPQFTRNGQNLVFITRDRKAVWVTFRPTPGKAARMDKLDAWECALFRNEGAYLSSELIDEAVRLSMCLWGEQPKDGFITSVDVQKIRPKQNPGRCYLKAGWEEFGFDASGRPRFKAPRMDGLLLDWRKWHWKDKRGGKLRRALEEVKSLRLDFEGILSERDQERADAAGKGDEPMWDINQRRYGHKPAKP